MTIGGWVVTRSEVKAHMEERTEGTEEMRGELRFVVRGYTKGNPMLGKDVGDKGLRNVYCSGIISGWYEDTFLGKAVYNH